MILWFCRVEDECSVFLWTIDNVVRYRGYRGVSVHVDSGAGQENCAEIIRKIKVIMNDRRTGWRKETLVTGSLVQWAESQGRKISFSAIPKDFLHPWNEFVLLTTPQCPVLQALLSCQDARNGPSHCDARCKWLVSVTNTALLNRLYLYRRCLLPAPESFTRPQRSLGPLFTSLR